MQYLLNLTSETLVLVARYMYLLRILCYTLCMIQNIEFVFQTNFCLTSLGWHD